MAETAEKILEHGLDQLNAFVVTSDQNKFWAIVQDSF